MASKLSERLGQSRLETEPHLLILFLFQLVTKHLLVNTKLGDR